MMANELKYRETEDTQTRAFMDLIRNAYTRGTTDETLTTKEFIEEIKSEIKNIYK
ncbi:MULTISPECIES: hypothetical protein [Bacillaceae]|uniref:hypothetical protein n=1 Tax=Bacillaceae TaxID=186817 RepID=UPI0015E37129|nr:MULTISPECIES: hypothetical protein [Bacillaceae]